MDIFGTFGSDEGNGVLRILDELNVANLKVGFSIFSMSVD